MPPFAICLGHVIHFLMSTSTYLINILKEKLDFAIGPYVYFLIISDIRNQISINRVQQIECSHNHKHGFLMENN